MEKHNAYFNNRARAGLGRAAGLAAILILALIPGGCLVSNEEYETASRKREEYSGDLQRLHQSNDLLKTEIAAIYESCDLISTQLTVMAAMNIHDQYTADLGRARPVLPPPIDAGPTTRRPNQGQGLSPARGAGAGQSQGGRSGSGSGTRRTSSGGQGGRSGGGTSTAPPSPPPANPGGGGGSIDWGF